MTLQPSRLAQLLYDHLYRSTSYESIKFRILNKLRRRLLRYTNPLVRYDLDGASLLLPLEHNLPLYRQEYPQYSTNIPRIAAYLQTKYPTLKIIDVGANIGDTAVMLRHKVKSPILCIEGSERYFPLLKANTAHVPDVTLAQVFVHVTDEIKDVSFHYAGGTASFCADQQGEPMKTQSLTSILTEYPQFSDAKFIKIDTDGLDICIIRSAIPLLGQLKPVLFFEYVPQLSTCEPMLSIFAELHHIGYETVIIYDNLGDYLLTTTTNQTHLLEDLHQYTAGRGISRYWDICAFHQEDQALALHIRQAETEFFRQWRAKLVG